MDDDDLIDPDELEKLLENAAAERSVAAENSAAAASRAPGPANTPEPAETTPAAEPEPSRADSAGGASAATQQKNEDVLDPSEIETLLNQSTTSPDVLAERASAGVAAAMSSEPSHTGDAQAFVFEEFGADERTRTPASAISGLQDVDLDLRIELGRTELLIEEVLRLKPGSVVPLDKLAGDPVDILVNGRLLARGEVLVLNDNFCVRVAEILAPEV